MGAVLLSVLIASAIFLAGLGAIWLCAYNQFWWCFVPANTFALVTWGSGDSTDASKLTGGELDKVLHAIPGMRLNDESDDPNEWCFERGEEDRTLLQVLFGIQWIGYGRTLRVNQVHEIRFKKSKVEIKDADGKDIKKDVYIPEGKDYSTQFIFYSREQAVEVRGSETLGTYELDAQFNLLYWIKRPVKMVFGMADPNSVLTAMVMEVTNGVTGVEEPEYFLESKVDHKPELIAAVKAAKGKIEKRIGIEVHAVTLMGLEVDEKTRALLMLDQTTKRTNKAAIMQAEKDKKVAILAGQGKAEAQKAINDAEADRITRVLEPMSRLPNAAALRFAEAVAENETLTTLVVGGETSQLLNSK
jgi:hypothetical protein